SKGRQTFLDLLAKKYLTLGQSENKTFTLDCFLFNLDKAAEVRFPEKERRIEKPTKFLETSSVLIVKGFGGIHDGEKGFRGGGEVK
nr:hypothetical protein [candidate division Zixibacteria bacterium]